MNSQVDTQSIEAHNKIAKLNILTIALILSGICFLWETASLVTYTLLAYFPDLTATESVASTYGTLFAANFAYALCIFIALAVIKSLYNAFIKKNPETVSTSKFYMRFHMWAWFVMAVIFGRLIWYPVYFYLGGGRFTQALISILSVIGLSLLITYLIFESQAKIINRKYVSPIILAILAVFIIGSGWADFKIYGTPHDIEVAQIDFRRATDLSNIKDKISADSEHCYSDKKCTDFVPESLKAFSKRHPDVSIVDPVSKKMYDYSTISKTATSTEYSICAVFTNGYDKLANLFGSSQIPYDFTDASVLKEGVSCLKDTINTDRSNYYSQGE